MCLTFLFSCADSEKGSGALTSETPTTSEPFVTTVKETEVNTEALQTEAPIITESPLETEAPVITEVPPVTEPPAPVTTAKKKVQTPTISISTEGGEPITSRDVYIAATVSLEKSDGEDFKNYPAQIRGRGNSTWNNFEKKPYRLKFDFGVDLFGMGENRDYVLLANAMDMSQLNNYAAFTLADILGMEYNCQCKFVNVIINGQYKGLYLLTEQIEVSNTRVDIGGKESKEVDTSYLVEFGGNVASDKEKFTFKLNPVIAGDKVYEWRSGFIAAVKSPSDTVCTNRQLDFISSYVNEVNAAIYKGDFKRFCELCDLDSFVSNVLVNEVLLANDFDFCFYMYKKKGGKLYLGPVWDFDQACGISIKSGTTFEGIEVSKYISWIEALLEMPEFYEAARNKWIEFSDEIHALPDHLLEKSKEIRKDINKNFILYDISETYWKQTEDTKDFVTYNEFRDRLIFWLDNRIIWLDKYFEVTK